ncbi:MAG TPA: precorrin-3B synthase [Methyloceanibacter sp.]|nr:precorrin-3B synthase [Methyloceanibacter sp.]
MSRSLARGACPRVTAPMQTGDGLLARLVPAGAIAINAFSSLCAAARTHGNGIMEVSARGSIQIRGLSPVSAPLFAVTVAALDIDICDGVPVLAEPLAGDPAALLDAHALATDLRAAIAASSLALAPKISVIVDGGGCLHLDALTADVRLQTVATEDGPRLHVSLAGGAASATPLGLIAPEAASDMVLALLTVIAAHGADKRAADILRDEGVEAFSRAADDRLIPARALTARPEPEAIGLHRLSGEQCAIGVALPFGQADAIDLIGLAAMARANGAAWIATAPNRTLLLGPIDETTGFVLATAADHLGFIVDARDARRRVIACPGAPACASGLIAARVLAAEIANVLPAGQTGLAVHVSGCAKGCAHPMTAPLTIVGTAQGCGLVSNGLARNTPERYEDTSDLVEIVAALETADA